jgi:hypothetical protein
VAELGGDVPTRLFKLGDLGVAGRTTTNSLAASYCGPRQDDQILKTKREEEDMNLIGGRNVPLRRN